MGRESSLHHKREALRLSVSKHTPHLNEFEPALFAYEEALIEYVRSEIIGAAELAEVEVPR